MSGIRRRGLRSRLSRRLVGVALVSVLLLSGVNFIFARLLINDTVESQVMALRDSRVEAVERGFGRLQANVSVLAANPSVVDALSELANEYSQLDDDITDAQAEALEALYAEEVLAPFLAAGADVPSASELLPASPAGRYVQYHYIAENTAGFDDREMLDDAGDGSAYSAAHAVHHPLLLELMQNARMSDLLLVDAESLEVVYSTKKRIDLGTNVLEGPYGETGLREVIDELSRAAISETAVSDSWFYIPTAGDPVFFLASALRSGTRVVGAVITEVPVEVITAVATGDGNFESLGLGETGEIYVVGGDRTLRSDSRRWIEDPESYLTEFNKRYDDQRTADLIAAVGSPVLLQPVDNEAITAGLEGDEFVGTVTSYLGTEALAAAGPAQVGNLDWVVVAEFATSETDGALESYVGRLLLVIAILLPLIMAIGFLIARNLTKPVQVLVGAAASVADGDADTDIPDFGRNEIGDVSRQLEAMDRELKLRQQEMVDEEAGINEMLTAVLPARLVDRVRGGEQGIVDIFDTATMISLSVDAIPDAGGADQDIVLEIIERIDEELGELMQRHGVERMRRSTGTELFVAGLGSDDPRAADASRFAVGAVEMIAAVAAEFRQPLVARAGLSAGDVATGVIGSGQMAFGVWGDPPGIAVTLDSLAQAGQVLIDGKVAAQLDQQWDIGPAENLPGLDDDIEAHVVADRMP